MAPGRSTAARIGAPVPVLLRMVLNVGVEALVGTIPFAGDVFDAAWKANQRNVRLLNDWLDRPRVAERGSRAFVLALLLGILALAAGCMSLTYLSLRWLLG